MNSYTPEVRMRRFEPPPFLTNNLPGSSGELQRMLVPGIAHRDRRVEACGETAPKDEVGGDLVDVVAAGRSTIACIADVSGHGLRASALMAMIKAAVRYGLLAGHTLPQVLEHVNTILPALAQPNMFATLAALRFDDSQYVEYVSAGHVPLLHYRPLLNQVATYSIEQFPLGLFAASTYLSRTIPYQPGDVFALITDGVVEAGAMADAEFGLERLKAILPRLAPHPLSEICARTRAAVRQHAPQHDDESILLVRASSLDAGACDWAILLDRLQSALTIQ